MMCRRSALVVMLCFSMQVAVALSLSPALQTSTLRLARRHRGVQMNFFDQLSSGLKQMGDSRTAHLSHVMLRTDEAALNYRTRGECYELLSVWKERIDGDLEKFEICARERSECASRDRGGDLGVVTPLTRGQLAREFTDVVFLDDGEMAEPGVYGPIETKQGLHLVYVHSSR